MRGSRNDVIYGFCILVVSLCIVGLFTSRARSADRKILAEAGDAPASLSIVLHTPTPESSATRLSTGSAASIPTATPNPTPAPITAWVLDKANLRSGPGINYEICGSAEAGMVVTIIGANDAGDWCQLADGKWIVAFLVDQ